MRLLNLFLGSFSIVLRMELFRSPKKISHRFSMRLIQSTTKKMKWRYRPVPRIPSSPSLSPYIYWPIVGHGSSYEGKQIQSEKIQAYKGHWKNGRIRMCSGSYTSACLATDNPIFRKAYIALSSMSQWGSSDNIFNLQEFYNAIVALFETAPEHPWVVDTLEWWNE